MSVILMHLAGLIVIAVFAVVAFAALKPDTFEVKREAVIGAPPEAIFPIIDDFTQWPKWSPWAKLDPSMKTTLSGPPSGVGAVSAWEGNSKVGAGSTEILESLPPRHLKIRLTMLRPMKAVNTVDYRLEPVAGGTRVTWAMHGANNLMGKVFSTFVDCDKMVGKDFEAGLANLKRLVEGSGAPVARAS